MKDIDELQCMIHIVIIEGPRGDLAKITNTEMDTYTDTDTKANSDRYMQITIGNGLRQSKPNR